MKRFILIVCMALSMGVFAIDKALDIRPTETQTVLTSVQWENTNDVALAAATKDEVLAGFVADEASAKALLAQVKGAYATDPTVACQIAAVSQWVMLGEHAAGRKVWVNALLDRAEGTTDSYVKMFCLDQLRWCGCTCPNVPARIKAIGEKGDKAVKEFSEIVLRELDGKAIGL